MEQYKTNTKKKAKKRKTVKEIGGEAHIDTETHVSIHTEIPHKYKT